MRLSTFAGALVVVVVKLCDLIDEAERELFAVEIAVGQRGVELLRHGVSMNPRSFRTFLSLDARVSMSRKSRMTRGPGGEEKRAESEYGAFFIGQEVYGQRRLEDARRDSPDRARGGWSRY